MGGAGAPTMLRKTRTYIGHDGTEQCGRVDKETQSGIATYRHTSQTDTTLTRNVTVQGVEL